jgi:hypothetical protein
MWDTLSATHKKDARMGVFFMGGGESGHDENPYDSTNLSGTNLDSRRLALERAARKGEAHGWAD